MKFKIRRVKFNKDQWLNESIYDHNVRYVVNVMVSLSTPLTSWDGFSIAAQHIAQMSNTHLLKNKP